MPQKPQPYLWLLVFLLSFFRSCDRSETVLHAQFTADQISIDGKEEEAWGTAEEQAVHRSVENEATGVSTGKVRALWDGALLYVFVKVSDPDISMDTRQSYVQDGISVFIDLYNDKYPKYEEDDVQIMVNAKGEARVMGTDGGRFAGTASLPIEDPEGRQIGYTVELAYHLHGIPMENGTALGMEIGINNVDAENQEVSHKTFWSSALNRGLDDNTQWGTVLLRGYGRKLPRAIDLYGLETNLVKAEQLCQGIWQSGIELQQRIQEAKEALGSSDQQVIDEANDKLKLALGQLRLKGPYPDPIDLEPTTHLPDPFTFMDGHRVENPVDWQGRAEEIKNLAQYYEYGFMPEGPENIKAILDGTKLDIELEDRGKTVGFDARLFMPDENHLLHGSKCPVLVSIDFFAWQADTAFTNAGYALLSFPYASVASDNDRHTGPYFELYPYDVCTGSDAGTLLAWAWGASRCVDALEELVKEDEDLARKLDLDKIVVTGFSRCGKAALLAGLFDNRFGVVSPGASGCGGAAVYRYVSFGNKAHREAPFGNEYAWGRSPGCEVLGDRIRHQGYNSNTMLERFLDPGRIYRTSTFGYGERLPYDHHEIIAAIAPRGVLITTAADDYSNNAEGDAIGYEGARPVFEFLGAAQNLALNIRPAGEENPYGFGGGHWLSYQQKQNLVAFANMVFYKTPLPEDLQKSSYENPYMPTLEKYYGGIHAMMPWL